MPLVLDASLTLSWYFKDERKLTRHLLGRVAQEQVLVPAHWLAELANGILIGERRDRSVSASIPLIHELIDIISPEFDAEGGKNAIARILPVARAHGLTIYDALYLELAERRGASIGTLDKDLADAARSIGREVITI